MAKIKSSNLFTGHNSGSSLIEFLISIGVVGVLVTGVSTFVTTSSEQKVKIAYSAARDSIYNKAVNAISNRQRIKSIAQSTAFRNCWNDTRQCYQTNRNNPGNDLKLLYNQGSSNVLVGSKNDPAVYNRWGVNCGTRSNTRNSEGCISGQHTWEASSEYWFTCPNKASSCKKPVSVNLRVAVKLNPRLKRSPAPSWSPFKDNPPAERKASYWTNIVVDELRKTTAYSDVACPDSSYQDGLDDGGKPICKCLSTHEQRGKNSLGQPICQIKSCKIEKTGVNKGQSKRFIGFDEKGQPICVPKNYRIQCNNSSGSDCSRRGWIQVVNLGGCKKTVDGGGGGGGKKGGGGSAETHYLECQRDTIRCCQWRK